MKKLPFKQTKMQNNQLLWQEISENAQDKISGGQVSFVPELRDVRPLDNFVRISFLSF